MRLIQPSQKSAEKGPISASVGKVSQLLPIGKPKARPEDIIVAHLGRGLDNRFVLLRDMQLEALQPPFPPILVGPAGLFVLHISTEKGFFKAREDTWMKMDRGTRRFSPARPNLIRQSQEAAKRLAGVLDVHGKSHPEVIPLLVFASAGVNIESSNPAVRTVLVDGLDSLTANLMNGDEVLSPAQVSYLADGMELMVNPEKAIPIGEGEDFFGRDLLVEEKKTPRKMPTFQMPAKFDLSGRFSLAGLVEKFHFSRLEWLLISVLTFLLIVILVVVILLLVQAA